MALFRKSNNILTRLVQKKVNLEKDIQTITEQNLETVFGLQLVASGLKIYIDIHQKDLKDPNNITNDCSNIGHWATGQTWFKVENETDLDYAIFLIKQSYEHNNND